MSWEQEKQAEFEIQQLLESIPRAKHFPIPRYEVVDAMISSLEGTIKRLKAFVSFLSLLNPMQYLKWMTDAYARYVPSTKTANNIGQAQNDLEKATARNMNEAQKVRKTISQKEATEKPSRAAPAA